MGGGAVNIPSEYGEILVIHSRWKMYLDFLEAYGGDYEKVLVTDVRDVIFQGDFFEKFSGSQNFLGYATEFKTIGEDRANNYPWLERGFGRAEADKLANKKIICAGTVIGTVNEMKIFCRIMWEHLKNEAVWGIEQAAMNYFVYEKILPIKNLIESNVHSGEIYTCALIEDNKIRGDKILRGDGGVPSVVHQYDRHPPLVELVDRLYRDKNFQIDERFTDTRSILDQMQYLLYSGKDNDAAKLFMEKFAEDTNLAENISSLLKIWEKILKQPLTPAVGYLELAVQSALMHVKGFSPNHLILICRLLPTAIKNRRAIYPPFVNHIASILWNIAESSLKENVPAQCFLCIDLINSFELPPDKDFYLFAAKVNRTFGRKEEALELYKKALDLS